MGYSRFKQKTFLAASGLSQYLSRAYHHPLSSLNFAQPPDPAMGKL